jgi:hypothetical protein
MNNRKSVIGAAFIAALQKRAQNTLQQRLR